MRPYTFTAKIHHSLSAKSSVPVSDDVPRYSTPRTGLHTGRETRLRPNLRCSRQTQHSPALPLLSPPARPWDSPKERQGRLPQCLRPLQASTFQKVWFYLKKAVYGTKQGGHVWYEDMKIYAPHSPRWGTPELKRVTRFPYKFPSSFFTYVDDFSLIAPRGTN